MRDCTLVYLYKPATKELLLAMKKRRFGAGKWNGVGGKLEGGESILDSAIRETREEICVDLDKKDLKQVATLDFFFEGNEDWNQRAHVFLVENWSGEPAESEEMSPAWYKFDSLPYDEMWVSDFLWLPRILNGEVLEGSITFDSTGDKFLKHEFAVV